MLFITVQVSVHLANFPSAVASDADVRLVPSASDAAAGRRGPSAQVLDASAGGSLLLGGWSRLRFAVPAITSDYLGNQV